MAIEKFEDLNRDLAAVVETVAEFGGGENSGWRISRPRRSRSQAIASTLARVKK